LTKSACGPPDPIQELAVAEATLAVDERGRGGIVTVQRDR
jgi:hypothetical protein